MSRLEQFKSSKLKEILLKRKLELEEICRPSHVVTETLISVEYSNESIESGNCFLYLFSSIVYITTETNSNAIIL